MYGEPSSDQRERGSEVWGRGATSQVGKGLKRAPQKIFDRCRWKWCIFGDCRKTYSIKYFHCLVLLYILICYYSWLCSFKPSCYECNRYRQCMLFVIYHFLLLHSVWIKMYIYIYIYIYNDSERKWTSRDCHYVNVARHVRDNSTITDSSLSAAL